MKVEEGEWEMVMVMVMVREEGKNRIGMLFRYLRRYHEKGLTIWRRWNAFINSTARQYVWHTER